jgi:HlyD family secretion protein
VNWGIRIPRQVWFAVVSLGLLAALAWVATRSGPLAPISVTVTPVVRRDVSPALFGIGTVEARRAHVIGPTTAGRVGRVLVDVGDAVRAGQLLAEMEPVDLDTRVAAATAAAERGRSAVAAADAQVRDAVSRHRWAATEARRTEALGAAGIVSQSAVDAVRQAEESAAAQLIAAEATRAAAQRDLARLEADTGGVHRQRGHLRLVAPVDGLVTAREVEPGSTVVAGQAVLRTEDPRSLWVSVRLDQARSGGLRAGLAAWITRRADPLTRVEGTVVRVEPVSDAVTEERIAKVAFDRLPDDVSSGEMAEVTLALPVVTGAIVVPNASLRYRGVRQGVWRYADGQLAFTPVTMGAEGLDGTVQILEGLQVGDDVVVYSDRDLGDDSRVTVVPALRGAAP